MREKETKCTYGTIETNGDIIAFSLNQFVFCFFKTSKLDEQSVISVDKNGYIWGKTYEGRRIGIYSENDIIINKVKILHTWNYILEKSGFRNSEMEKIRGIQFCNGSIKSIFKCQALDMNFDESENGKIVFDYRNDSVVYNVDIEDIKTEWIFRSSVEQRMSLMDGNSLKNSEPLLEIHFDVPQKLDALKKYYEITTKMNQFLIFRNEVAYDRISLLQCDSDNMYQAFADVYVDFNNDIKIRSIVDVISIFDVKNDVFSNLIKSLSNNKKKNKGVPLFIQPKNSKDSLEFGIDRIKNICSALEMELDMSGVSIACNESLNKLVCEVKKLVKSYQETDLDISNKTYDTIFGNLSHWCQPLSERAWEAWKQHQDTIKPMLERYDISISESDIAFFVKARNNITHNGITSFDDQVATTSFSLLAIIYCCTLTRLGMDDETIKNIMRRRLFE